MRQSINNLQKSTFFAASALLIGCQLGYSLTLLDTSTAWSYLHPQDATDPVDGVNPASSLSDNSFADADFQSTWFSTGFDDSLWQSGTGTFGYANIGFFGGSPGNDFGQPTSGDRFTAYFRADFTTSEAVNSLSLSLLADDGAFIYLDGVKVAALNFSISESDTYTTTTTSDGDESSLTVIDLSGLGILSSGTHTIAISVHQSDPTSSDLGFQAQLDAIVVPEPASLALIAGAAALCFVSRRRR